jgi:hypothetical protein
VKSVLTERRVKLLEANPLAIQEFIGPLSRTYTTSKEEYEFIRVIQLNLDL